MNYEQLKQFYLRVLKIKWKDITSKHNIVYVSLDGITYHTTQIDYIKEYIVKTNE